MSKKTNVKEEWVNCNKCNGTGFNPRKPEYCKTCWGDGKVKAKVIATKHK
jgi:DnaJ-class molecular chaperone